MNSNVTRVVAGIAVVVVAVVLFAVLKDDGGSSSGGDSTVAPAGNSAIASVPTVVVKNGKPVGGVRSLVYKKGDRVRFQVDSDIADEIHVHSYDIMKDVKAGGSVRFDFPATIEGIFEAELEDRGVQILELTVNP